MNKRIEDLLRACGDDKNRNKDGGGYYFQESPRPLSPSVQAVVDETLLEFRGSLEQHAAEKTSK